ncbi:MAG: hypothetical protein J6Y92_07590 [Lentisphaeria bacterium]|nr:hypothetical protein [Lentisphaeria bacterium]
MRNLILSAAFAAALLLSACTNVAKFDYQAAPGTLAKLREPGSATKSVAVMPFMDQRGIVSSDPAQAASAHDVGDHGSFFLGFIPLMPFGYVEKTQPENSEDFVSLGRFHFDVQNDLAAAAMASLKSSGLFSNVVKANNAAQAANADYIWRGSVTSTFYRGRMFSYGITYCFSHILWIVGIPYGSSTNELGVKFELVDRASGDVVWDYSYFNSDYLNHWIYARVGKDVSIYPRLMKEAMNGALYKLAQDMPDL